MTELGIDKKPRVCWKLGVHDGAQVNAALVPVFVFSLTADSDRLLCRVALQGPDQKTCFEEHTEYVALEVNLSKSGWPTMYETLQVVLLHVFNITFYAY